MAGLTLSLGVMLAVPSRQVMAQAKLRPVPRAACGPHDRPESVQGQTTLAERFRPGPATAYTCNLELVGQFEGEGAGFDLEVLGRCAYYATAPNPQLRHPGVAVLDVSDSRQPKATTYLNSPGMLDAGESLVIDERRQLLLVSTPPIRMAGAPFEVYDLSADCRHPVLKSSTSVPGLFAHVGQFTADSRTFYGAKSPYGADPNGPPPSAVFALDASDPATLRPLATWIPANANWQTHSVSVNTDGTRAYVGLMRQADDQAKAPPPNGLVILDVSDIPARRPHPQFRVISTLFWDDTHWAQFALPVRIQGRPYLIFTDLLGAIGMKRPPPAGVCDSGKPGHGFARIIDIGDEKHPKAVSKLMLEVADPANCAQVMQDPTTAFGYGPSGCDVDQAANAKLLACGYFEGGLRVFDIRQPTRPREVAYYKPPARRTASRPGSPFRPQTGRAIDQTADQVPVPRFRKHGEEIWFISFDNGFQVVHFTDRFQAAHPELFRK